MSIQDFLINKVRPFTGFITLLLLLPFSASASDGAAGIKELKCLALNIFFEARGESHAGQVGVGMVTVNRVRSGLFQPTICGVVYAKSQFSWTQDQYSNVPNNKTTWNSVMGVARTILTTNMPDPTNRASHFFNPHKIRPSWARKFVHTATIGNHVFYRMPGFLAARSSKNNFDLSIPQDDASFMALEVTPEEKILLLEQNLRVDDGEHAQRYQEFLQYIDTLPEANTEYNQPKALVL
ncbi:MAG: cell wall hydrolase [Bdellovibrio sp.]